MPITLEFMDGTLESSEIQVLKDLTRTNPNVYLYDPENGTSIKEESITLEEGKKYIVKEKEDVTIQPPKSPFPRRQCKSCPIEIAAKKNMVIKEILDSEKKYYNGLNVLYNSFRCELLKKVYSKNNIHATTQQINFIFKDIYSLLQNSNEFLQLLEIAYKQPKSQIGLICYNTANTLKLYTPFISEFEERRELFQELKKNQNFTKIIDKIEKQKQKEMLGNNFASIFISPIQRIPKYSLLFNQLLSYTHLDTDEYSLIEKAIELCDTALLHCQKVSEQLECVQVKHETKNIEVPESMNDLNLNEDGRIFQFKEEVQISKVGGTKSTAIIFIFNDCILITKYNTESSKFTLTKFILNESIKYSYVNNQSKVIQFIIERNSMYEIISNNIDKWDKYLRSHPSFFDEEKTSKNSKTISSSHKNRKPRLHRTLSQPSPHSPKNKEKGRTSLNFLLVQRNMHKNVNKTI